MEAAADFVPLPAWSDLHQLVKQVLHKLRLYVNP